MSDRSLPVQDEVVACDGACDHQERGIKCSAWHYVPPDAPGLQGNAQRSAAREPENGGGFTRKNGLGHTKLEPPPGVCHECGLLNCKRHTECDDCFEGSFCDIAQIYVLLRKHEYPEAGVSHVDKIKHDEIRSFIRLHGQSTTLPSGKTGQCEKGLHNLCPFEIMCRCECHAEEPWTPYDV